MQLESEYHVEFVPPIARVSPTRQAVTYPLGRLAFLAAVEQVIPQLVHPATGQPWEFDGYRRTELDLAQPAQHELGLTAYTVTFDLHFGDKQTTIALTSSSESVQQLYCQLTRELALHLLRQQVRRN